MPGDFFIPEHERRRIAAEKERVRKQEEERVRNYKPPITPVHPVPPAPSPNTPVEQIETVVVRCRDCNYQASSPIKFVWNYYLRRHMLDFKHHAYWRQELIYNVNDNNTSNNVR
jgi:hypothetical protein